MPIPSSKWFPTSLQNRAAWYNNFNTVFQPLAPGLGFTVPEAQSVGSDAEDLAFIAATQVELDSFAAAFRQYRISVTEDPIGTPQPTFPSETFGPVPNDVPAGMFQRLIQTVDRIRAHPTYTDEMGANLGIIPSAGGPEPESSTLKPNLRLTSLPGNVVEVKFTRGDTDGIALEMQFDIETNWSSAGKFLRSPAVINVPAGPDNLPRAVRLRARYLDGNDVVGENSDIVSATTNP